MFCFVLTFSKCHKSLNCKHSTLLCTSESHFLIAQEFLVRDLLSLGRGPHRSSLLPTASVLGCYCLSAGLLLPDQMTGGACRPTKFWNLPWKTPSHSEAGFCQSSAHHQLCDCTYHGLLCWPSATFHESPFSSPSQGRQPAIHSLSGLQT